MLTTCPHCGEELPRSTGRIGTEILGSFLKEYGGTDKLGRDMAEELQEAKGHTRALLQGRVLNLVENEDRARSRQRELEDFSRQQERAIVMEQGLYLLEHDEDYFEHFAKVAEKRGMLVIKAQNLIETQAVE